jgi:hypothetical protein
VTNVLIKRRNSGHRHTEKSHVKINAEVEVICPQAKDHLVHQKLEGAGRVS